MPNDSSTPAILGGNSVRPTGPPDWPQPDPTVAAALTQAYSTGDWGRYHGGACEQLTADLRSYFDCEHAQLTSSGTAAVELALRGCRVEPGDEVIMAGYDYKPNFQNIVTLGAKAVLVDVNSTDGQLDSQQLIDAFSPKTKAVIASHLHGGIVDMPRVMNLAGERNVLVVEDACQVTGATVYGRKAGMWGDVGVISFGGSKLLTAGRGGAVYGNSADIMQRIRLYEFRGNHTYPMSSLQGTVVIPQLRQLDEQNKLRTQSVQHIVNSLKACQSLKLLSEQQPDCVPAWYKVGFRYDPESIHLDRETFCNAIRAEGFAIDPAFRAIHLTHSTRRYRAVGDLPNATLADTTFVVLHHPLLLESPENVRRFGDAVQKIEQHAAEVANAQ